MAFSLPNNIPSEFAALGALGLVAFVLFLFTLLFANKRQTRARALDSLKMSLFSVRMFKYESEKEGVQQKRIEEIVAMMEQVYSAFLNLLHKKDLIGPPRVIFEVASPYKSRNIEFFVAVPRSLEESLQKYIQGVFPKAEIEKVSQDYTVFVPRGVVRASFLKLQEVDFLPITTYQNFSQDALSQLTNTLSKISENEGAGVQIVLNPFNYHKFNSQGKKIIELLKKGKSLSQAVSEATSSAVTKALMKGGSSPSKKDNPEPIVVDEHSIEAISNKIKKPSFEVNIRLVISSEDEFRAGEILSQIESAFSQFSGLNNFKAERVKPKKLKNFIWRFIFREFSLSEKIVLNLEELASVYHFPTPYLETPNIVWARTSLSAPPADLPQSGEILLGEVVYRGERRPVYFATKNDRRRHFYIIGQTGTGKTSLLREMIRQDVQAGRGVGVIDPHGDLIEDTLANVPPERYEDVVLFEPFNTERPMGLNMLEYETSEQKDFAVQEMIAIFQKLFPPEIIGPMFEHYMRNAMLALMANKEDPGTLVEIPRIFTDDEFMEERLKRVTDPVVRLFWLKEWKQTSGHTKSDMLGYVVSKVGRFIENEMMRNIIGQAHSAFNLSRIMDEGKIFLANLSKGLTGEVNSSLLGLILVSKMQMAAMKRASIPQDQRRDFYLYIDEFQNFTTDSIATILSEARKYRLNLILAHQYIPQLPDQIKYAVLGNVGTIGSFRIGVEDAAFLESQFSPEFSKFDLSNLDNFNLIVKLMVNNKITPPFRMRTIPPKEGNYAQIEAIKKLSRLKYGKPKEEVEREILERSKLTA